MADDFYDMPSLKAREGYRWVNRRGPKDPAGQDKKASLRLVPVAKPGEDRVVVVQRGPFQGQTGLFRRFSKVQIDCKPIQEFANKFGNLRGPLVIPQTPPANTAAATCKGVSFPEWRDEILAMRAAILLWTLLRDGDGVTLARHVVYRDAQGPLPSICFDSHPDLPPGRQPAEPDYRLTEEVPLQADTPAMQAHVKASAPVMPANFYLQWLINRRLKGLVELTMLWDAKKSCERLRVVPNCLLGGLWLQFAEAVSRTKTFRDCDECDIWFEVSPQAARTNRRYCSEACKSKHFRQTKSMRERHGRGAANKEIAEETGFHADTAKERRDTKKKGKSGGKKAKGKG